MAELNIKFGQTPFWAICRFGERSKIEIIVFSFICAKRFRKTEEADCPRQEILEYTKLDKSQISVAIGKLVKAKWLEPRSKTKWFVPEIEPAIDEEIEEIEAEKVDDSSTNVPETEVDDFTTKVDESSTEVEKSSTKVDESSTKKVEHIRNSFSSDSSDSFHTTQPSTNARAPDENLPVETAAEIVERVLKFKPSIFTEEALDDSKIENLVLWEKILNEKKAGMTDDQSKNLTWKNKAVQFALTDYGKRNGEQNGSSQKHQNADRSGRGGGSKPSNSEIVKRRDYSKFDGFDPVKTFG